MKGTLVKAPQSLKHSIDLSVARVNAEEFEVEATEVRVVYVPDGCSLQIGLSSNGPFHTVDRAGLISWCDGKIPSLWVKNAKQSGIAELQYSPDGIAFDFPPKGDAPSSPRENISIIRSNGAVVVDFASGQSTGQNKILANVVNVAQAPLQANLLAKVPSATRIGSSVSQDGELTTLFGLHIPTLFNLTPAARNYLPLNGRRISIESDFVIERTPLGVGRYYAACGWCATGALKLTPNWLGFMYHEGPAGNLGFPTGNLYFGMQVYNSAGNWKDMKIGNTNVNGGIIRTDTGISPANDATVRLLRVDLEFVSGVVSCAGFIDGVEVARQTGPVPFMAAETLANLAPWFPSVRSFRESAAEYCQTYVDIHNPTRVWMEQV